MTGPSNLSVREGFARGYQPDDRKASAALRPSKTLNDILAMV